MIPRRSIRIKVLQALFAYQINDSLTSHGLEKNLIRSIDQAYTMYLYGLFMLREVMAYVERDKVLQSQKLLKNKTEDTPTPNLIILQNPIYQFLANDETFQALVKLHKLTSYTDKDVVKACYKKMIENSAYNKYCELTNRTKKHHTKFAAGLFKKVLCKNELYRSHLEERFLTWIDDRKMISHSVNSTLQAFDFKKNHLPILVKNDDFKERTKFGINLLHKTIEHQEEFVEMITPQLINWEIERVNSVDVLLMKMALCELVYFPTIPVKVTINEYIEVAKLYSTPRSKDFVNGILDALLKRLKEEGRIQKLGRGLLGQ